MLNKYDGNNFQSSLISDIKGIKHGFSSRVTGDMGQGKEQRRLFVQSLGFQSFAVFAEQIHSNAIGRADNTSTEIMSGVDGLVSRHRPVAIIIADCVPVLMVDPINRVCAAVHAGWRGTLKHVVPRAVRKMVNLGAQTDKIYGVIGPHIGACCYTVPEERSKLFQHRFGQDKKMVFQSDNQWHLDVGWLNYRQLIESGISDEHIDAPPTCTSCQHNEFFSFRKDAKKTTGKMMAVIGFSTI